MKEDKRLQWFREMVELLREQKNPKAFLKSLKINLIPEEVYVFTPKGRVISLPAGASALDFAFRIHTEIGLHSASARISGKASPLKTILKTGDIVEIVTSPEKYPSRSWLNNAFTSSARHQIKRWLNQQGKAKSITLGKKLWERNIRKYALPPGFSKSTVLVGRIRQAVSRRVATLEDFFALAGLGKVVINKKLLERILPAGLRLKRKEREGQEKKQEIQVKDRDGELVHLARCCSPIKGEPILGYITAGKGISAHALRCPLVAREILAPERLVEVSWGSASQENFKGGLIVRSADTPGLLAEVASVISRLGGNIAKAEVETFSDNKAQIKFSLTIRDIKHLEDIIKGISSLRDVHSVERF
jgi:GTP pyrophosphokinase